MLKTKKMILAYGLDETKLSSLKELAKANKLPFVMEITPNMTAMTLLQITAGMKFNVELEKYPTEKAIVFNSLSDKEVNLAIGLIRQNIDSESLLALATKTTMNWKFSYLVEHLAEERESYSRARENKWGQNE